jgi:predicted alpha-1,2-mannosidase
MIYLYQYAGQPWKTQYWVREAMNRLYSAAPDGYCGDEDNGQTSAWYVWSAIGCYPVCPGTDQYILGAPLFKKMTLELENGKQVVINAPANNETNRYVDKILFNGKAYNKNWLSHKALMEGAVIDFTMSAAPNKQLGVNAEAYPYSFSKSKE